MVPAPEAGPETRLSSRRHFATIAWLRWRIFVNGMRGKGAAGELVVKFLSYPFLVLMILGPAVGSGIGSYYLVDKGEVDYLAIPFWIIFVLWQFIGVNTSATGPSFDLSSLIRFPIRYRDYLLIRLSFGLMDPPTLAGIACLIASSIGIAFAAPALFPWAVLTLAAYALCNILFSRMVYSWLERWLAQRRTRELVTGVILALSLGAQFAAQFAQRLSHPAHHAPPNPLLMKAVHWTVTANWFLPPGLAAKSMDQVYSGSVLIGVAALGGVLLYALCFLFILHRRLLAEFRGEDLSEAPAARPKTAKVKNQSVTPAGTGASFAFLPSAVAAGLLKEIRYLLRSGPKLYVLIMPVFVVFLFSARTTGMNYASNYAGVHHNSFLGFLFCYGCAYTQLIFVGLIYNSLGSDGTGVQFYFIAPIRMRDVMLAKNLLTVGIFLIEAILIYVAAAFLSRPTALDLTVATLAWSAFALLLNLSVGNVRSIVSPKVLDPGKMRSQNVSGINSLISLIVVVASIGLGALVVILCGYFHASYWVAAGFFLVLSVVALGAYMLVLKRIDEIAHSNLENLTTVLSRI
jgi:ABC-2 type transport system permease protein